MRTMVAGWFSFKNMGTTAGDLISLELACRWLDRAGHAYDVALAPPFEGGVDWRAVDPAAYSHFVFVCGPFPDMMVTRRLLSRFNHCRLVGLNLSMIEPLEAWNPFDALIERDSSSCSRPDMTFLSDQARVPVVGIVLVHPQPEYKDRGRHDAANAIINQLVASRAMAAVNIDTCLDSGGNPLRSPAEVESLIARMDVVVTTRLHGTVFALKNGVPAIAVDPIAGGAKVRRQAETIGWPAIFCVDDLRLESLQEAFDYCLTEAARLKAKECGGRAAKIVEGARDRFIEAMNSPGTASARTVSFDEPLEENRAELARDAAGPVGFWQKAKFVLERRIGGR
ncbi:MAG: polysaccharide pyruvyl transferase family protein [Blastocatellia bacterium]